MTTKGEGHGMGLSIVRQTVEEYGGSVTVSSDAQETAFCVAVPM